MGFFSSLMKDAGHVASSVLKDVKKVGSKELKRVVANPLLLANPMALLENSGESLLSAATTAKEKVKGLVPTLPGLSAIPSIPGVSEALGSVLAPKPQKTQEAEIDKEALEDTTESIDQIVNSKSRENELKMILKLFPGKDDTSVQMRSTLTAQLLAK